VPSRENDTYKAAATGSRSRTAILAGFGVIALRHQPIDALLDHACDAVLSGVAVRHVKVLEYQPDADRMLVRAGRGWRDGIVGHATLSAAPDSPSGRAYQTGRSVQVADIRLQSSIKYSDLLREHGIVSLLNVPIRAEDFRYGVLEVDGTSPQTWTDEDVFFLEGFTHLIAAALQRNMAEQNRNTLYRELQHRLANNAAMITTLIESQRRAVTGEEARSALTQLAIRVRAINRAHSLLRPEANASTLDVKTYLGDLCENLRAAIPVDRSIDIHYEIADRIVALGEAIPLGLIMTELVSNSIEHAFPETGGRIDVRLIFMGAQGELTVADNGKGMSEVRPGRRGLQLVSMLAAQLHGTFETLPVAAGSLSVIRFRATDTDKRSIF
jgi:two-component sensor histidine kinase